MKKITIIEANQKEESILRVAAYARVSTDEEAQLVSLKTQKAHYEKIISENESYTFAGLYFDEGITGTKKEYRDGLLKMLKDCENGKIDFILTKSISRLARNTTDCLEIVRRLLDLNVGIYFEKENIDTRTMESELMLSILSSLAESESRSISENNKWSIKKRFQSGTFIISSPPYGYENIDGKIVVNEEEGQIIKEIFKQYLSGKGTHKIAEDLNKRKIQGQKGASWHGSTINGILKNEKYIGDVIYQKTYTDENYNRHKNKGEEDQYKIIDNHEAIVSREDFEKVQDLIKIRAIAKGNGENTKKYQNRYSLSGKIKCGECGSTFKRRHHYNGKDKYIAWTCSEHLRDINKCSMKFIKDKNIKLAFVTLVNKLVFGKDNILTPLLESLKRVDSREEVEKINKIEESLEQLKERKKVLSKLITSGVLDASIYAKESSEISSEEKNLLMEKERSKKAILGNDEEIRELEKLIGILGKSKMLDYFEGDLFEEIIDHIQVVNRETLDFHLKCGLVLREEVKEDV
ncbi:resolvase protein [Aedoeadaptatus coxii]|uniref:recombinase family protein n=1 Tax=Aedoeadaptatus coxii TaxID=755172 RepID=UPI001762DCF7|nr:recombinase family protein [Peptoniphilus coxii]CAC9931992.1 resolvase protein [Peptoniphilus coxii]